MALALLSDTLSWVDCVSAQGVDDEEEAEEEEVPTLLDNPTF